MPRGSKRSVSTDRQIMGIKPASGGQQRLEYRIEGTPGLFLRVTEKGTKTWAAWIKDPRTSRWRMRTLGTYPMLSLAKARQEIARLKLAAADGGDPFNEPRQYLTLAAMAETYIERHAKPKKRSACEDERILHVDVLPALGEIPAERVTRADVIRLLEAIVDRGAGVAANRTLALIRKLYNFSSASGLVSTNPAMGIPMPSKEVSRSRVLDEGEIRQFWTALDAGDGFDPVTADALRLQLLLGARIREITGMERAELSLEGDPTWLLHASRSKTGREVLRPLPPLAVEIIQRRLSTIRRSSFVFATLKNGTRPITSTAPAKAVSRAAQRQIIPTDFTPHDLRRTFATGLMSLGVTETVAKKILGHSPAKADMLGSVYNKHAYLREMREALERWELHILGLVGRVSDGRGGLGAPADGGADH